MAVYDNRQMNKMRQDAIRRSQEMYRRSMGNAPPYQQNIYGKRNAASELNNDKINDKPKMMQPNINTDQRKDNKLTELMSKLTDAKIDSDKLIVIALMVLLAKEGADMKLILALGYILL